MPLPNNNNHIIKTKKNVKRITATILAAAAIIVFALVIVTKSHLSLSDKNNISGTQDIISLEKMKLSEAAGSDEGKFRTTDLNGFQDDTIL